jgi:hypothetical protein
VRWPEAWAGENVDGKVVMCAGQVC